MLSPLNPRVARALPRFQSAPKPQTHGIDGAPTLERATTDVFSSAKVKGKHRPTRAHKLRGWSMPRLHPEDWTKGGRNRRRMREARQAFVERDFERALEKASHVAEETQSYDSRLLSALVQISMGERATGDAILQTLLRERQYDEATNTARALLAYTQKDAGQAWIGLTQVTVHYPGNSIAWVFRALANGTLNYENLADMDIAHLRRTLPENILEPVVTATNELRRNIPVRAFAELDKPHDLPNHPAVVDVLWAHTNDLLGFREDALATYDAMLARDPTDVVAAVLRAGMLHRPADT